MQALGLCNALKNGYIQASEIPSEIPSGFFGDAKNRATLMKFFNEKAMITMKSGWEFRRDADEISAILSQNTLARGFGIFDLRRKGVLADVLSEESMATITAFETVMTMMRDELTLKDFNFWVQFAHKYRACKFKDVFWPLILSWDFSDEQRGRLLGSEKLLKYVPEEMRTEAFWEALKRAGKSQNKK